jgi:serine/threonine-protein kinase ULK/ATG1
MNKEEKK